MFRKSPLIALVLALVMFAAACGSDGDPTDVTVAGDDDNGAAQQPEKGGGDDGTDLAGETPIPVEPGGGIGDGVGPPEPLDDAETPIPVEPDGGIGDGAEPLPGASDPDDTGTWHGPEVAVTNCPGTEWKRVEASEFGFSVPTDFTEVDVQPIDSEVGVWSGGNGIEVAYDYGWYSGSIASTPGAENTPIDYSGIEGELSIVRSSDPMMIGVLFPEVAVVDGQTDRLGMIVNFTDPDDEIIGRCILGSITFD